VITRHQLLAIGYTGRAIDVRIEDGRLHRVFAGVYAVGRPHLTRKGYFIAGVLACGNGAALSHQSAAELWEISRRRPGAMHVTIPAGRAVSRPGITVHRRASFEVTRRHGVPVTNPVCTLVDLATTLDDGELERAVNEAVNRDLTDPERLRRAVAAMRNRPGSRRLAALLDRDTYAVTDSRLEQRLLRVALDAGLPKPQTQQRLRAGRVDFYWPDLELVVEADSLRYHRTPAQQRADGLRDRRHAAGGFTPLRFTHWQIVHDPAHVGEILTGVAKRLARQRVVPVGDAA
jgi:very-short-patch-repair endonuclease